MLMLALLSALALALAPGAALAQTHRASCPAAAAGAHAKRSSRACPHTRSRHAHAHARRTKAAGRRRHVQPRRPASTDSGTPGSAPASCQDGSTPSLAAEQAMCADGSEPMCADGAAPHASASGSVPVCAPAEPGSDGAACSGETCTFDSEGPVELEETTCEACEAPAGEKVTVGA